MTNEMIIFMESCRLMKEGKLSGSGRKVTFTDPKTKQEITVEAPEQIHTFEAWKERGFSVKKGEHAIAQIHIWKYVSGKKKQENEEEPIGGKCIMKKAFFFKASQVEKITKKALPA